MAIIQALLAAITRWAGTILNTAFGWATMLLFGKIPRERQIYVSINSFGSVLWLISLLGIAFPAVTVFLLSFVKPPEWVDRNWIRIAMLIAAIILPALVGINSIFMRDPAERPVGFAAKSKSILKGYPYTAGMAITLVMMLVFAPIMEIRNLARRWTSAHVPMMVESKDYLEVADRVQRKLADHGFATRREPTTWMLRYPTKLLSLLAGGEVHNLVADQMTTLVSPELEVMLHPSDLVIRGAESNVAHARAVITEHLGFSKAHLTWDKEANQLEDRLRKIWIAIDTQTGRDQSAGLERELERTYREITSAKMPYEEWQVLFVEHLLVERQLFRRRLSAATALAEDREATTAVATAPVSAPKWAFWSK
jgi:hypothetical protein